MKRCLAVNGGRIEKKVRGGEGDSVMCGYDGGGGVD